MAQNLTKIQPMFDVNAVRGDFPILTQRIRSKPLIYFDNAASLQKPLSVIEAESTFYKTGYANVHRSPHTLGHEATVKFEAVRKKVKDFINAPRMEEVIFTKGTTEGINLIAQSLMKGRFKTGECVLLTELEHHSNIVPWQLAGFKTVAVRISEKGEIDLQDLKQKIADEKPVIIAFNHVSNALGSINPAHEITKIAHENAILSVIDGCQTPSHLPIDVQDLGADFYVFSAHKMGGPTGCGVIWGRADILSTLPPYQGGGEMIHNVSFEKTTFAEIPNRFEAGTPNIAQVIGLGASIDYMLSLDFGGLHRHEEVLLDALTMGLRDLGGVTFYGTSDHKIPLVSFGIEGAHPADIAMILDEDGIAIRAGHHCCQPLMRRFKVSGMARASLAFYNTLDEIEAFLKAMHKAKRILAA